MLLGQHTVEDRSGAIVGTAVSPGFTRQFRRDFRRHRADFRRRWRRHCRRHWRHWLQAIFQSSPSGLGLPTYGQISALVDPAPLKALVAGTIASAIEGTVFRRHLLVAGAIRGLFAGAVAVCSAVWGAVQAPLFRLSKSAISGTNSKILIDLFYDLNLNICEIIIIIYEECKY